MMQFLWLHIDEIVGKGLPTSALLELFFYNFLSSMPLALPLAVLLASLMSFGDMGEKLEILAMKTAGISLFRIMRPMIILVIIISIGAFFFSNNVIPIAQKKMWTLLFSIKNKSPELDIPVGEFYSGIDNIKMYVRSKNHDTGALHNVMIYDFSKGFKNTSVTTADTLLVDMTEDQKALKFNLINGESFENLEEQKQNFAKENVPYRRETFKRKTIYIAFDANFNMYDENTLNDQHVSKDFAQLKTEVDSIRLEMDSVKTSFSDEFISLGFMQNTYKRTFDSAPINLNFDSLLATFHYNKTRAIIRGAKNTAENRQSDLRYKATVYNNSKMFYARHAIEMHRKFTMPFACLVFFFIGAPLGAIIRKGGLGMPTVISVVMFIIYFIIDTTSIKFAREGLWDVWQGMWTSAFVLLPIGAFLTYTAARDSGLFNADAYRNLARTINRSINKMRGVKKNN